MNFKAFIPYILFSLLIICSIAVGAYAQLQSSHLIENAKAGAEQLIWPPSYKTKNLNKANHPNPRINQLAAEKILKKAASTGKGKSNDNQLLEDIQPFSDPLPGCADTSQRRLYWQQNRPIYVSNAIRAKDGGIFIVGATIDNDSVNLGDVFPYILRLNAKGKVLWNRQLRGKVAGGMILVELHEMKDGSLLAAGNMDTEENDIPGIATSPDALLVKITKEGDLEWSRTFYRTKFQCSQGFGIWIKYFHEMPDGDLIIGGTALNCPNPWVPVIMRLTSKGEIIWTKAIGDGALGNTISLRCQAMFVNENRITLIFWRDYYLWKVDMPIDPGGVLEVKSVKYNNQNNTDPWNYMVANNMNVIQLSNGNYRIVSNTLSSFSSSLIDTTSICGILDLTENFEPIQYQLVCTSLETNYSNQFIYLHSGGGMDIGFFQYTSDYSGDYFIANIDRNGRFIKQRKMPYTGIGLPYKPSFFADNSGNQNLIQTYYDSSSANFFIENTNLNYSDTPSACIGYDTASVYMKTGQYLLWPLDEIWPVYDTTVILRQHTAWQDTLLQTDLFDGCKQVNYCDSISIIPPNITICRPNQVLNLETFLNKACGSWVQWRPQYPEKMIVRQTGQKMAEIQFKSNYDGWLYAEMQGNCAFLHDSIRLNVAQLPDILSLGPDTLICPGNRITLKATTGYAAYQWSSGSFGDSLNIFVAGKYWVTAKDACGGNVTDTILVNEYVPPYFSAGEDKRICPGESITLNATTGYFNYSWLPDSAMQNPQTSSPTVRPKETTTYLVKAEEQPGCFVTDSVIIQVSKGNPFSLGPDFSICTGDNRLLSGPEGFATYTWNTGANTRNLVVNKTGTYILEAVSTEGCPQRDTVVLLSLNPLPSIKLDKDSVLCVGETKIYTSGTNYTAYLWNNGTTNPTLTVNQPGTYWLQVTDANGCRDGDTSLISRFQPLPASFLPADTTICSYDSWQISPLQTYVSYLWSTGAATKNIVVSTAGNYKLAVTDADGCKGVDEVRVNMEQCMEGLFVPTAFTPNGDGTNDDFRALLFGHILLFDFRIYNRFGEQVFVTNHSRSGWNGTFKGKHLPAGTFVWQCRFQLQGQDVKEQKGTFILIR